MKKQKKFFVTVGNAENRKEAKNANENVDRLGSFISR